MTKEKKETKDHKLKHDLQNDILRLKNIVQLLFDEDARELSRQELHKSGEDTLQNIKSLWSQLPK